MDNTVKRLLSLVLCCALLGTTIPQAAFATEQAQDSGQMEEAPQTGGDKCICETPCTTEAVNGDCPVCGADTADCGGEAPVDEETAAVQEKIGALPSLTELEAMTAEQQQAAYMEIQKTYDAYKALTEEEQAQITGAEIFESLLEFFNGMAAPLDGGDLGNGLSWGLENGTLTISGSGAMPDFDPYYPPCPYYPPWWDNRNSITNVTIGDSVTSIGNSAFNDCTNLESVTIGDSVTSIGESAFNACTNLKEVWLGKGCMKFISFGDVIPNNDGMKVTISGKAEGVPGEYFRNKSGLKEVVIEEGVQSIGEGAFGECTNLESVTIGENVTSIGAGAFRGCGKLTAVTIPGSVTSIGNSAFNDCTNLESVTIGDSVTSIDENAFGGCTNLKEVWLGKGCMKFISFGDVIPNNDGMKVTISGKAEGVPGEYFRNKSGLKEVVIEEGVQSIGEGAFGECTNLESVTIGEGVQSIGEYAFSGCEKLTAVTIGEDVTSIGAGAFSNCTNLGKIISKRQTAPTLTGGAENVFYNLPENVELTIPVGATGYESWPGYQNHKTSYSVTVLNGVGGEASASPTEAAPGTRITLTAEAKDGYHFKEWTSTDISISDADKGKTPLTFTMPDKAVAVNAVFEAHSFTKYVSNNNGTHQVKCSRDGCNDVKAPAETCSFEGGNTCTLCHYIKQNSSVQPPTPTPTPPSGGGGGGFYTPQSSYTTTAASISRTVSKSDLNWLIRNGKTLTLKCSGAEMSFRPEALQAIVDALPQSSSSATFAAAPFKGTLPNGARTAYDFTLTDSGKKPLEVTFPAGSVTIGVAYTPKTGEDTKNLYLAYVGGNKLERVSGSAYKGGTVSGDVAHFSTYAVAYEQPWANPFTDVSEWDWFYSAVEYVNKNGLMTGTTATTFSPDTTTSRAMIATILWRQAGSPVVDYLMDFEDVAPDSYYAEAVRWAASEGIVSGYGNGSFGPNDPITREQLATMLYNYEKKRGGGFTGAWAFRLDFPDMASISEWAYEPMCWCVMNGIITGTSGGRLNPGGYATRAETAAMLQRYLEQ